MSFEGLSPLEKHRLSFQLKPIFIGQLLFVDSLEYPAFHYQEGEFKLILDAHEGITSQFVAEYAKNFSQNIFIYHEDFELLNSKLKEELTKLTRSLSIGNIQKNALKHTNLLSMQMGNLYNDPFNDELLSNQFQNSKNLSILMLQNKEMPKLLYHHLAESKYHFTVTQPLLSSFMFLSFIQSLKIFNERELEGLFLTSYFKDLGMSFIPREKFELAHLNQFDRNLFSDHAKNSMLLLDGRVPLSKNQLSLIKNHHYLNYKIQTLVQNELVEPEEKYLTGIESTLLSATDIITAMTSSRPYRQSISSFKALELLKKVISDEYPQEFKALVYFIKNFLDK